MVRDTDKSLQKTMFKLSCLLQSLCLYPISIFFPQRTYNSPKELIYLSTCYGLSLLLEVKCQKKKDYYLILPPLLHFSTLACSMDEYWAPISYTLSHSLDIYIMCVEAICVSWGDISLEYHVYTSNCLLETWLLNRYLKFNMYSSISHSSMLSLI